MSDTPQSKQTGGFLAMLYVVLIIGVVITVPYYNWQFAQKNGFAAWLFLGEIVPTLKGLFWPIYLVLDNLR